MYNQGIVVYQVKLPADNHTFSVTAHDYAIVWVNGDIVATFNRSALKTNKLSF
jgi:hypothetical protein